jgi:membrane protease subunit HflK
MQQIYGNVTKVLVDSRQGSQLLYLPLDKILQLGVGNAQSDSNAAISTAPSSQGVPLGTTLSSDARGREAARTRERDSR